MFIFAPKAAEFEDEEPFVFRYPTLPIPVPDDFPATIPISNLVDRLLPSLKLDVIHAHHPVVLGEAARMKAQDLDLPLVFTFHSQYDEYGRYYVPFRQEIIQELLRDFVERWIEEFIKKCHHIIAPSKSNVQTVGKYLWYP